ncbi:thermonuclease family protein [Mesomycoplasma moatsii]|uniref:thermonuclease family protein n=1 Tax=Mesomycoplasma moatsii TaxID=171287 RepID=UPI0003FDA76B
MSFSFFSISFTNSCNLVSHYSSEIFIENVIDGDTFLSNDSKYRILGIDTPETYDSSSNFKPTSGPQYFYGTLAKEKARELLGQTKVDIEALKKDKYDRWISKVTMKNGLDFSSYMIKNGYAIVRYISPIKSSYFYYYDSDYIDHLYDLQNYAKINKMGFWSESNAVLKKIYPK